MTKSPSSRYYQLGKFNVINSAGESVDLTTVFDLMVLYESLNQAFMTAVLTINMPRKWFTDKKIGVNSKVNFEFTNVDFKGSYKFVISRIEPTETIKDQSKRAASFIVYLVSQDASSCANRLFQRKYSGKPEAIIQKALSDFGFAGKFYNQVENTAESINFVGMNFKVDQFIQLAAKFAISTNKDNHGYLFFENVDGYNFVTIDKLLNQTKTGLPIIEYAHPGYDVSKAMTDFAYTNAGFVDETLIIPNDNIGVFNQSYNDQYVSTIVDKTKDNPVYSTYDREIFTDNGKFTANMDRVFNNIKRIMHMRDISKFNITDMPGNMIRTSGRLVSIQVPYEEKPVIALLSKVKHVFQSSISYRSSCQYLIV